MSVGFRALTGSVLETRQSLSPHQSRERGRHELDIQPDEHEAATRWVVGLTAIGSLMAALDTLVVSTALSTIRLDLGASVEQLEWTVNAYNLSFAVLLITGAALGDRYGRRNLYAVGWACSRRRRRSARWRPTSAR